MNRKSVQVAVLYGNGGTFCAGYDLKETADGNFGDKMLETLPDNFNPFNAAGAGPLGPSRKFFSKPVIAAVSGHAVAGGFELALACDLRVVEKSAIFGVFCRRFGVPLIDGGTGKINKDHIDGRSKLIFPMCSSFTGINRAESSIGHNINRKTH